MKPAMIRLTIALILGLTVAAPSTGVLAAVAVDQLHRQPALGVIAGVVEGAQGTLHEFFRGRGKHTG